MKPKLIIVGSAGRMGKRVLSAAMDSGRFDIIAAVEKKGCPDIGKDAGQLACGKPVGIKIADSWPAGADVAIDFSQPQAADDTIHHCLDNKIALVMGTTGLTADQHEKLKAASKQIPILYSTNMSLGMNVLFALVSKLATMLGDDYDIEIVEQHHRFKKDAPSGSAVTLAENICKATGCNFSDAVIFARHGKDALRKKGQIAIHSVRAGDITGIHSVIFGTTGETISVNHTAHSPDCFAKGAVAAALWLIGKTPALYSMADVLNVRD
jgi:4-hydroxy-tetrahydrodipicolinate reductase